MRLLVLELRSARSRAKATAERSVLATAAPVRLEILELLAHPSDAPLAVPRAAVGVADAPRQVLGDEAAAGLAAGLTPRKRPPAPRASHATSVLPEGADSEVPTSSGQT